MSSKSFLALSREALAEQFASLDEPSYRADQIRRWIFSRRAGSYSEMTDLPARLRSRIEEVVPLFASTVEHTLRDPDGTRKILVRLAAGDAVEAVLIPAPDRMTACISTQVGCPIACVFCASGLSGFSRNLEAHEIVEQVLHLERLAPADALPRKPQAHAGRQRAIDHVVVMGMGEPLLNLPNLMPALRTLNARSGFGLGARHITVSTSGLPERMRALADEGYEFNLAVSLHAPDDALRSRLVPANRGIGPILDAAHEYVRKTGRDVTIEYVLLRGQNDRPEHARLLARILGGLRCNVNLIPYNSIGEAGLEEPTEAECEAFASILRRAGFPIQLRRRRGDRIAAACGQLRSALAGKTA